MVISFAATDKGKKRAANQDGFYTSDTPYPLFVLCDGMGGHASGDIASQSCIESVKSYIEASNSVNLTDETIEMALSNALKHANEIVYSRSLQSEELKGMGTTADVAVVIFDTLYVSHVGDSRVYLLHGGELKCITKDHSLVQKMVDQGLLTADQARVHPNRNVITRALGTEEEIESDFLKVKLSSGDIILMCSDGLHSMLSDMEIKRLLISDATPQGVVQNLIDKANENGGDDNITAIVVHNINEKEGEI